MLSAVSCASNPSAVDETRRNNGDVEITGRRRATASIIIIISSSSATAVTTSTRRDSDTAEATPAPRRTAPGD